MTAKWMTEERIHGLEDRTTEIKQLNKRKKNVNRA